MKKIFEYRRTSVSAFVGLVGLGVIIAACSSEPGVNDPGGPGPGVDGGHNDARVDGSSGDDDGGDGGGGKDATADTGVDASNPNAGKPYSVYTQHNDNGRTGQNLTEA